MSSLSEQQQADFDWYVENLLDLYFKYGPKHVAIKNKTVLGVYDSFADAVKHTREYQEPGTFIVQKLGHDESAYMVKMPRMMLREVS